MNAEKDVQIVAVYARTTHPDASALMRQYQLSKLVVDRQFEDAQTVIYFDDGKAGSTLRRPAMQAMLRHINEGQVKAIVVADRNRLTRSHIDHLRLTILFERLGVPVIVAGSEPIEVGPETPPEMNAADPAPKNSHWPRRGFLRRAFKKPVR